MTGGVTYRRARPRFADDPALGRMVWHTPAVPYDEQDSIARLEAADVRRHLAVCFGPADKNYHVLLARYGIHPWPREHTLAEIALIFGITKERVRQRQLRAELVFLSYVCRLVETQPALLQGDNFMDVF